MNWWLSVRSKVREECCAMFDEVTAWWGGWPMSPEKSSSAAHRTLLHLRPLSSPLLFLLSWFFILSPFLVGYRRIPLPSTDTGAITYRSIRAMPSRLTFTCYVGQLRQSLLRCFPVHSTTTAISFPLSLSLSLCRVALKVVTFPHQNVNRILQTK